MEDAKSTALSRRKLENFKERQAKRGVIYMSRVPPFMRPDKVRSLLEVYGKIGRIYLAPEDKSKHERRKKAGGNKKIMYTEGWIEFDDKRLAKSVAKSLNAKPIGGKKRNFFANDLWNLKYLKGFKWEHLTEKLAYEQRIREQKLRMEFAQATRENAAFLENVDKSRRIAKAKAHAQREEEEEEEEEAAGGAGEGEAGEEKRGRKRGRKWEGVERSFKQARPVERKFAMQGAAGSAGGASGGSGGEEA